MSREQAERMVNGLLSEAFVMDSSKPSSFRRDEAKSFVLSEKEKLIAALCNEHRNEGTNIRRIISVSPTRSHH
jgi:uncharacterized protein YicC (UPF0701 family)